MGYLFEHLPPEERAVHEKIGWGRRMGFGERPALLVIDMRLGWTDPESSFGTDMSATIENINKVLAVARETKPKIPIFFTQAGFESGNDFMPVELKKSIPNRATVMLRDSKWQKIDPRLVQQPDEILLPKTHASCFVSTNLAPLLVGAKVDTVIITGCSINGCVLATAISAFDHGFHSIVVEEAVGDRDPLMAVYSLLNMDSKWADVVSLDETIAYLSRLKG